MNGKEVYKFATREVPRVIEEALEAANMNVEQVDWLLLHQVRRIILTFALGNVLVVFNPIHRLNTIVLRLISESWKLWRKG